MNRIDKKVYTYLICVFGGPLNCREWYIHTVKDNKAIVALQFFQLTHLSVIPIFCVSTKLKIGCENYAN